MAGSVNKVILIGYLGNDPDVRALQEGKEVANLTVATSESWNDRASGEKRERTEWHRVVIFAPGIVTFVKQYLRKGSRVYLEGSLQTRKWQDQSGQERYTTQIILQQYGGVLVSLSKAGSGENTDSEDSSSPPRTNSLHQERDPALPTKARAPKAPAPEFDDDIPF